MWRKRHVSVDRFGKHATNPVADDPTNPSVADGSPLVGHLPPQCGLEWETGEGPGLLTTITWSSRSFRVRLRTGDRDLLPMCSHPHHRDGRYAHRGVALGVLVTLLLGQVGWPRLDVRSASAGSAHSCGCTWWAQTWGSCCCRTTVAPVVNSCCAGKAATPPVAARCCGSRGNQMCATSSPPPVRKSPPASTPGWRRDCPCAAGPGETWLVQHEPMLLTPPSPWIGRSPTVRTPQPGSEHAVGTRQRPSVPPPRAFVSALDWV